MQTISQLLTLYRIGHSTHEIEKFLGMLQAAGIQRFVDVRTSPSSRRYPQYNMLSLKESLASVGIGYRWESMLGGHRPEIPDFTSPNVGLRHPSFRNYGDYMLQSPRFVEGMDRLIGEALQYRTVIVCAEAVWWKCHTRMICDAAMLLYGARIHHLGLNKTSHKLTDAARLDTDRWQIIYDNGTLPLL